MGAGVSDEFFVEQNGEKDVEKGSGFGKSGFEMAGIGTSSGRLRLRRV